MPPTDALIAARCGELLNTFNTTLLADLRQLSSASVEDFADQQRCARLLQSYSEVTRTARYRKPCMYMRHVHDRGKHRALVARERPTLCVGRHAGGWPEQNPDRIILR